MYEEEGLSEAMALAWRIFISGVVVGGGAVAMLIFVLSMFGVSP